MTTRGTARSSPARSPGALNTAGVVGIAYSSQLLVAKVVADDGTIPLKAEAAGIRWAVKHGARVVNLSFGAVRDPENPDLDSYSKVEAQAVAYAVRKGAVVVAAVGNADEAYTTPWPYASWPAALPHVIGVGALTRSGKVPDFSDQDLRFVDLAAPGVGIFSTFPRALTNAQPNCSPQGYTDCAIGDYRHPEGTSFAAPQVAAAAAVLFGVDPSLTSSQVTRILERHADDVDAASGCADCPVGRDKLSGWGGLDVTKAVNFLQLGQSSAAVRPPRAERQPQAGAQAVGQAAGLRRDARLLGRPRRRLPREARAWRAAARAVRRAVVEREGRPDPVAAANEVGARGEEKSGRDGASREDAAALVPGSAHGLVRSPAADRAPRRRPLRAGPDEER